MKSALVGLVIVTAYTLTTPVLGQRHDIANNEYVSVSGNWAITGFASSDGVHPDLGVHIGDSYSKVDSLIVDGDDEASGSYTTPQLGGSNTGDASISSTAAIGHLHAFASVSGGADDNLSLDAHSAASTVDHIMFLATDLPSGTEIDVRIPIIITGGGAIASKSVNIPIASTFAKAYASYLARANAFMIDSDQSIAVAAISGGAVAPDNFSLAGDFHTTKFFMEMEVKVNEFFGIELRLEANAHFEFNDTSFNASVSGSGSAIAAFQNSLVWGGIDSVTDPITGQPIQGWSVVSRSGADYSKSFEVPEPSSVVLLSFVLCPLLGRARTRGWRS